MSREWREFERVEALSDPPELLFTNAKMLVDYVQMEEGLWSRELTEAVADLLIEDQWTGQMKRGRPAELGASPR